MCSLFSQEKNKMDVQFANDEMMCEILQKESVQTLRIESTELHLSYPPTP